MSANKEKTIEAKNILVSLKKQKPGIIGVLEFSKSQKVADERLKEILFNNDGITEIVEIYKELQTKGFETGWREKFVELCEEKA